MAKIPQPFLLEIAADKPEEAPKRPSPWAEPTKYMRDMAKWMVGGIIATAGAIIAGSSLTAMGALDPAEDGRRLLILIGGAAIGFLSIGLLLNRAVNVFLVRSARLDIVAGSEAGSPWHELKSDLDSEFGLQPSGEGSLLEAIRADREEDQPMLAAANAMMGYLHVRRQFRSLVRWMPGTVAGAAIGFGLFAWAANPPPSRAPSPPPPLFELKVSIPG